MKLINRAECDTPPLALLVSTHTGRNHDNRIFDETPVLHLLSCLPDSDGSLSAVRTHLQEELQSINFLHRHQ